MKKLKVLLVLANAFIALLIFFVLNDKIDKKERLEDVVVKTLSNLHSIKISSPPKGQLIEVVKKEENWILKEPFSWDVEKLVLSNFTTKFAHLNFKELYTVEEIEGRGEIVEDYGLDKNSTTLELNAMNSSIRLMIGKETRDGQSLYAQVELSSSDAKSIWKVSRDIIEIIQTEPLEWGVSTFINRPLYSIDQFSVTFRSDSNNTNETELQKDDSGWKFTKPFLAAANNEKVLFFLNSLISERIEGFARSLDSALSEKLHQEWRIKISLKSMGRTEEILVLGPSGNAEAPRAAKSAASSTVFLLNEDFVIKKLSDLSTQLRERTIFDLTLESLDSIEIKKQDDYLLLSKEDGAWLAKEGNLTDQKSVAAESESVNALIQSLNHIKIKEFLAFNPDEKYLEQNGFSSPGYTLDIIKSDTGKQSFLVSEAIEGASLSKIFSSEQSLICVVDKNLAQILSTENLTFRNKSLLPEPIVFDAFDLIEIEGDNILFSSDLNSTERGSDLIASFRAGKYLSSKFDEDGTWGPEDNWFDWKFKISFRSNSVSAPSMEFFLSDRKGATSWYAGSKAQGVTFNLPISIIDELGLILNKKNSPSP